MPEGAKAAESGPPRRAVAACVIWLILFDNQRLGREDPRLPAIHLDQAAIDLGRAHDFESNELRQEFAVASFKKMRLGA